jgi:hypothetical protein
MKMQECRLKILHWELKDPVILENVMPLLVPKGTLLAKVDASVYTKTEGIRIPIDKYKILFESESAKEYDDVIEAPDWMTDHVLPVVETSPPELSRRLRELVKGGR